ncbi:hypothetical protein L1049_011997 [Liquidambar formosana]|uniref:Uncharacterized protein n=1 Tax=Liquidambar formosana TaxID=63359 RepID=A0AAP0WYH2_LIQFO
MIFISSSSAYRNRNPTLHPRLGHTIVHPFLRHAIRKHCDFGDFVPKPLGRFSEKSFYEVLGQNKYPPSSSHCPSSFVDQNLESTVTQMKIILEITSSLKKLEVEAEAEAEAKDVVIEVENKLESENFADGLRGNKTHHPQDVDLVEQRSNEQSATVGSEMFDLVLLCNAEKSESALREALRSGSSKNVHQNGESKGSNGGKAHCKKQRGGGLRTLLTLCAQAVADNNQRSANELLKQIRHYSSPMGAWDAKNGPLFLDVCPFVKISIFFSRKTVMHVAEKATRLHITDFGILYGFPVAWPHHTKPLSSRPGGPPKLRITEIDFDYCLLSTLSRLSASANSGAETLAEFSSPCCEQLLKCRDLLCLER